MAGQGGGDGFPELGLFFVGEEPNAAQRFL